MDRTFERRSVVLLVAALVIGALVSGLGVWASLNARLSEAEDRAVTAEERVRELESELETLAAALEAVDESEADASELAGEDEAAREDANDVAEDGRFFCYVTSAQWEGDTPELTVDYAQLLTGDEAAAAATAAGEESPPPNDYFILNENPRLRTFPVDVGQTVRMTSSAGGTRPEGYEMVFSEWYDAYSGMSGSFPGIRDVPYWIEIENGTVVRIEEQYLP